MIWLASLVALLPFLAAFAGMLFGPSLTRVLRGVPGGGPGALACVPVGISAVLAAIVAFVVWRDPARGRARSRWSTRGRCRSASGWVDGLSAVVALMVCCVALAVQVYSVAYMRGDRRYSSYAAFISLFTSAMLLVVYAGDLLLLYVGWEVMGICSYFLIGHHWEERANSRAAVKAFLVTRLGDVGFLIGVIVLGVGAGRSRSPRSSRGPGTCPARRSPRRRCCCSSASRARARSSRCTPGCRTRWRAPRRSAR